MNSHGVLKEIYLCLPDLLVLCMCLNLAQYQSGSNSLFFFYCVLRHFSYLVMILIKFVVVYRRVCSNTVSNE